MKGAIILALGTAVLAQSPAGMGPGALMGILMNKLDQSPEGKCHQLSFFQNLAHFASDPQIQDAITGGNETEKQMGANTAAMANAKLAPLLADNALVAGCVATVATDNEVIDCLMAARTDQLNALLANQTMLDAATHGDKAKQDSMRKLAAAFKDRTDAVHANQTEDAFCKSSVDMRCINERIMTRYVALAADDAAVQAHFQNETRAAHFKEGAAKAQQGLDSMKADAALTTVCQKMPNIIPVDINAVTLDDLPK